MTDSPLETETTATTDTVTFKYFDREWTVPTKQHLSHIKKIRDEMRAGIGTVDLMIAETFLSPEDFDALLEIDPRVDDLDNFTSEISKVMGLGGSGNYSPSSASS